MAISDILASARDYLGEVKRKNKFKKANKAREDAVQLQATLAQCRGKLETCMKDLNRAINTQSANIVAGMKVGADTVIQEQILWDAAIGYMLVRDAIFALETINSYDAVSHAYEMLDLAMKQMAGKKTEFPGNFKIGATKERNAYGYITSGTARKTKEDLLESFFENLKREGNIEKHLAEARNPAARQAENRFAYMQEGEARAMSDLDARRASLEGFQEAGGNLENIEIDDDAIFNIHPPKDNY